MCPRPHIGSLGAWRVTNPIVALDDDTINAPRPQLDRQGKPARAGSNNSDALIDDFAPRSERTIPSVLATKARGTGSVVSGQYVATDGNLLQALPV